MTQALDLRPLIETLWRRRYLFWMPILIMLPISGLFAKYSPKLYMAKSLILLQEAGRDNPLTKDQGNNIVRMQERIAGLVALAKSDRVLSAVLKDVMGDKAPIEPRAIADWKLNFAANVGLDLIGTDFLELSLKSSQAKGLGKQLTALTSRFLEVLLAEQSTMSATQMLIDQRKQDLDAAEKAYADHKTKVLDNLPIITAAREAQAAMFLQQAQERAANYTQLRGEFEVARKSVATSGRVPDRLDAEIDRLVATISPYESHPDGGPPAVAAARDRLAAVLRLREIETWSATVKDELDRLNQQVEGHVRDGQRVAAAERTSKALAKTISEARELHQDYTRRYMSATSRSLGVLSAPERIKLIDLPRDPEIPLTSGLKYALAGIFASIGLALGLVLLAEAMDQTVRYDRDFARLAGAPVLVRLP